MMDQVYRDLLEDLSAHPEKYPMPLMRRLTGERFLTSFFD